MDSNDRLIRLSYLHCVKCKEFLFPPVMHTGDCDNICNWCYRKEIDKNKYKVNGEIEEIIKLLTIPCRNNNCPIKLPYNEIIRHEPICEFKIWKCSAFGRNCPWSGLQGEIVKHFEENHNKYLMVSDNYLFKYFIRLKQEIVEDILLSTQDYLFILYVNKITNKIYFSINQITINENNFMYRIEVIDNINDFKLKQITPKNIKKHDPNKIFFTQSTDFNLKPFNKNDNLEFSIYLLGDNVKKPKLNHDLLSIFKCPGCKWYMNTLIFQCVQGHSICERCYGNSVKCLTCNNNYEDCRNYALEKISLNVNFPCYYEENGCKVSLTGYKINYHLHLCPYKTENCTNCEWTGINMNMIKHFRTEHNLEEIDKIEFNNNLNDISEDVIFYNNLFRIQSLDGTEWICRQLTGFKFDFKYELILENKNEKIIYTRSCYKKEYDNYPTDENSVSFDKEFISKYSLITLRIYLV